MKQLAASLFHSIGLVLPFQGNIRRFELKSTEKCNATNIPAARPLPFVETVEKLYVPIAVKVRGQELRVVQFASTRCNRMNSSRNA